MKIKLILTVAVILLLSTFSLDYVFDIPESPQIIQLKQSSTPGAEPDIVISGQCSPLNDGAPSLDEQGTLNILVWNIYKENQPDWSQALARFSRNRQLLLLQESSLSPALESWLTKNPQWQAVQANAFSMLNQTMGVMNISGYLPLSSCAYVLSEPLIRLPKSALISYYPLSNQQTLAVVNVHSVNFSLGLGDYRKQLKVLARKINAHEGPVIFAGDFNSWSEKRMEVLRQTMSALSMIEITYDSYGSPDHRKQFLGHPLDHLFYRDLVLNQVKIPETTASDHNPILASFSL